MQRDGAAVEFRRRVCSRFLRALEAEALAAKALENAVAKRHMATEMATEVATEAVTEVAAEAVTVVMVVMGAQMDLLF